MTALANVLDVGGEAVARALAGVEERLALASAGHGELLARFAGDTISAGGKRLRPLLLCLAAGVPPPDSEDLMRAGAAVELVHAASLVHDDVLDAGPPAASVSQAPYHLWSIRIQGRMRRRGADRTPRIRDDADASTGPPPARRTGYPRCPAPPGSSTSR